MVNIDSIAELLSARQEWLLVREAGATFPLQKDEIELTEADGKTLFGFLDDNGFHSWRLNSATVAGSELVIDVAGSFARRRETLRLVPRELAGEVLSAVLEARLQRANDIGELIAAHDPAIKLGRVALNEENGRLAQIEFSFADNRPTAAMADVTAKMTVESLFTSAMLWSEKLGQRKKRPINDLWLVCEKRQARAAQKLLALLDRRWRAKLTVVEIDRKPEPPRLKPLPGRRMSDLWREKAPKLVLPASPAASATASMIIDLDPDSVDLVLSKQGETLRFKGLPFARVRTVMGVEKAWFGVGRDRRPLTADNIDELAGFVEQLGVRRSHEPATKRHEYYRTRSESWLESILRRDIRKLDANLILSPIYNQFRSSNDKIDLLAIRNDGRLVIIELKTQPDREMVLQAVDYWRKIELQRRRGLLDRADLFDGRAILDKPAIIYLAAPAWSFHRDFEVFARAISSEIDLWRFELHENWRRDIRVIARVNYADALRNR